MRATILILLLLAATTAKAQTVTVKNVVIEYNQPAAQSIGFRLDVTNLGNGGGGSGLCRDAITAIKQVQYICNCVLTPAEVLSIFNAAKEEAPDWALRAAGVIKL